MPFSDELRAQLEESERVSVSDSFGGPALGGRAPDFRFADIVDWIIAQDNNGAEQVHGYINRLGLRLNRAELKYVVSSLFRFSFLIELTNLGINSTKMKTRWVRGEIIKTRPNSFENYRGEFSPGHDERSVPFQECLGIFTEALRLLTTSNGHVDMLRGFSSRDSRGTPYESALTYVDNDLDPLHVAANIRLVHTADPSWLISARPIFREILTSKNRDKIATKCYKTDRAQTGEVQTNRAKRWECLKMDYQHATLEECWSVERRLLQDLAHFDGFPIQARQQLIQSGLFGQQVGTVCPITLLPMDFSRFQGAATHGESRFQVGHMHPLKAGGSHDGNNIAWISNDGNRIQGDLDIAEVQSLLRGIFQRMNLATQAP
ncbi:hypothetical protein [Desulfuromonas sp.]|uniref:hypothetical protein n=1 Tax=Desulfuromonas sp. TaxID=892 RepID=UPI0025C5534A|nr:hypothetical protein [Desulfuromonas sp.]